MCKLNTHSPIYCIKYNWKNKLNLRHTIDRMCNLIFAFTSLRYGIVENSTSNIYLSCDLRGTFATSKTWCKTLHWKTGIIHVLCPQPWFHLSDICHNSNSKYNYWKSQNTSGLVHWHHYRGVCKIAEQSNNSKCLSSGSLEMWTQDVFRDHFVYAPSQWETTLQCNVVSHWLCACT